MKKVRLGVIGTGVMGQFHLEYIPTLDDCELTAVCDIDPIVLKEVSGKYNVPGFANYQQLIDSGLCDAVIISTPHYPHPRIAMAAFDKGLHVLVEKPLAVTTKAAREVIARHSEKPGLVFGIMFQQRTFPLFVRAREIIRSGEIGDIRRVSWIMTTWFRTQAYYNSGGWRATWGGEGGGVLLNQAVHTLDILTWITGLPERVTAQCGIGKYHQIEVEDEVSALLEYSNGASGQFFTTTAESPGSDQFEIVCDCGRLLIEPTRLLIERTGSSLQNHITNSVEKYTGPATTSEEIPLGNETWSHKAVTKDFLRAVLTGAPLLCPAPEGLNGLMLGNAMVLSGLKQKSVSLPLNDDEYDEMLRGLAAKSSFKW